MSKIKILARLIFTIPYHQLTNFLKRRVNSIASKLDYPFSQNPSLFEDLTPNIIDDAKVYTDSLNWALRNKNIKNIALTGSYGSGKSSILKTFKENYKEFKYLNISLATFEDERKDDDLNKKVELSILQQLLYLEKGEKLPNSRFKRIKNYKFLSLFGYSVIWILVLFSFVFLFYRKTIKEFILYKEYLKDVERLAEISATILFVLGFFFLLNKFIKTAYTFKFDKINTKGEVELNREVDSNSILNRNLDEIIYFFERTSYNVVIIEDLDRFKEPEIFTKLREINLLANNSKQVNRRITFIYALRDDMFKDGKRTKFFDFIIPIIPVINSYNSFDFLKQKLTNENIKENLLDDISLFIDDMRLLKNIINEFKIYKAKLTFIRIDSNKLLAFVVYKNLYPEDFTLLQFNNGMIFNFFKNDIKNIKNNLVESNLKAIDLLNNKLTELEQINLNNIQDLRRLYVLKLFENLPPGLQSIQLTASILSTEISKLISDQYFDELLNMTQFTYLSYVAGYSRATQGVLNKSFKKIEEEVDVKVNYLEKARLITAKQGNISNEYNSQIVKLKKQSNKLENTSAQNILNDAENLDLLDESIKSKEILIYFLRKGFIAEDYFDYISIFYEESITRSDKNFILSIRNRTPLDLNYKLDKIEGILKKIKNDFNSPEVLNIQLLDFLFEKKNDEFIDILFTQFSDTNERLLNFVDLFIVEGKNKKEFIKKVNIFWDKFWDYILKKSQTLDVKIDYVLKEMIYEVDNKDLIKQNSSKSLSHYVSQKNDFLNLINESNKKIQEFLLLLGIKFSNPLISNKDNITLLDFIYENEVYELNRPMIEFMVVIKGNITGKKIENLKFANYSTILDSGCQNLIKYIDENIETYITNVFLNAENVNEEEPVVLQFLNNKQIQNESKLLIIERQNIIFNSILSIIEIPLWSVVFELGKVKPTWENLIYYFKQYEFDNFINSYLNIRKNAEALAKQKMPDNLFEDELIEKFIPSLLLNDSIQNQFYDLLLKVIENSYDGLDLGKINEDKIKMLIERGIIALNSNNFELLRQNSLGKEILLIELNFEKYLEISDQFELEVRDYELLLSSKNLSFSKKKELSKKITSEQILKSNNLANLVSELLLKADKGEMDYQFLLSLVKNSSASKTRVKLFNFYFDTFSTDNAKVEELLVSLNDEYVEITHKGNRPKILVNEFNNELAINLKRIDYISSYEIKDSYIRINTKKS